LKEQKRSFRCAAIIGEVVKDARLFLAAKRRVGQYDIDPLILANFRQTEA